MRQMYKNRKEQYPLPIFEDVKEEVIVSLTSYGERIKHIMPTIKSLQEQSRRPDKIVVYIANEDKNNVTDELKNAELVEIRYCQDIKSFKKFLGFVDFPSAFVATADDDLLYNTDWLKTLLRTSQIDRRAVVGSNMFLMDGYKWGRHLSRKDNTKLLRGDIRAYIMSGAGVLRPPVKYSNIDLERVLVAFNFSKHCDEKSLSKYLEYMNQPILCATLAPDTLHKESYKLNTGGLWEQHNCKNQELRWSECKAFITYLQALDKRSRGDG